jgi:DNA-nicking Smr family endonuclease
MAGKRKADEPEPAWELDLHGKTVEQALKLARQELFMRWKRGQSPGLLITGRGVHSGDGVPRLYEAIKELLHDAEASQLGIRDRRPGRGGGSWLVYLWPPGGRPEEPQASEEPEEQEPPEPLLPDIDASAFED